MLGFSDPFTKIDGDDQGSLVQNSRMTRVYSSLSHNFLSMASPVNGHLQIALGDKLRQVGIKSFIGFTKQVQACPK